MLYDSVIAVVVSNLSAREMLLAFDSDKFFTEAHYNGVPAVLVRLDAILVEDLEDLIIEAWKSKATQDLIRRFEES